MRFKKVITIFLAFVLAVGLIACSGGDGALASTPNNFTVTVGNKQAILLWEAPTSDGGSEITKYQVSSGDTWIDSTSMTSHTFTDLKNGSTYTFKVRAVNKVGFGEAAENEAIVQTENYTLYTLDRIIMGLDVHSPNDYLLNGVKDMYGTKAYLYEDNTISFSGSLTSAFGRMSYVVAADGKVSIYGISNTFNNTTYEDGYLSLGFSIGEIKYSFSYYNDEIWFKNASTYTLSFDNTGDSQLEPVQRKEREALNPPTPILKGYTFRKWTDQGLQWPAMLNKMPGRNHEISASWDFHFNRVVEDYTGRKTIRITSISDVGKAETELYIPDKDYIYPITEINENVFRNNTSITSINLGDNLQRLGNENMFQGMTALKSITLRGSHKTSISELTLAQINENVNFYVPPELLGVYKSDSAWSVVANRIFAIE